MHDPYGAHDPEHVIERGLPPLVASIAPGTGFPLAVWRHGPRAAVLYLPRIDADRFADPSEALDAAEEYEYEIEHLILEERGWSNPASGGGTWVNALEPPAVLLREMVVIRTGTSAFHDDVDMHYAGGVCDSRVASIETADPDGARVIGVDAARPFFLTGASGWGRVRVLDRAGRLLHDADGRALEWTLGEPD